MAEVLLVWGSPAFNRKERPEVFEGQRAVQWLLVCAENLVRTQPGPETTARNPGGRLLALVYRPV